MDQGGAPYHMDIGTEITRTIADTVQTEITSRLVYTNKLNSIDYGIIAGKVFRQIRGLLLEQYDESVSALASELEIAQNRIETLESVLMERGVDTGELDMAYNTIKVLLNRLGGDVTVSNSEVSNTEESVLIIEQHDNNITLKTDER